MEVYSNKPYIDVHVCLTTWIPLHTTITTKLKPSALGRDPPKTLGGVIVASIQPTIFILGITWHLSTILNTKKTLIWTFVYKYSKPLSKLMVKW